MNKTLLIGIALILFDRYLKKRDEQAKIPPEWYIPSTDYWYTLPVGTANNALYFEDDVMSNKVHIMNAGAIFSIEPAIIAGMIGHESKGVVRAKRGRYTGLMQLGLEEAISMGYKGTAQNLFDPWVNIYWGTSYLRYCIEHRGTLAKGISGYNSGQVEANPTYRTDYVNAIIEYTSRFRFLLSKAFPGYATIFPRNTWLVSGIEI